ncbi:hypothetical protein EHQ12_10680 [Leptospira gomenensis]|uniref:Uncharacterized protein n=1 Tax=Leptospira gomenensis TaxID=2484974 RepID=A0A5F1Y5F5_9LEPT|nr:hypothetical protein [Leptospira gomenensis]TGK27560.1 hypothetical protein EHQ17_19520 [Leptospira gomenensis]TGK38228.1 hypothetical protein EHQ12_10680 [Leptospira gomenensis]TGK42641.1 hypothetical protein EHQ07_14620 [Leptospira gomenensis]TGK65804.1 hypothetical protein EHQ13_04725 [Leptospira gomenensis]
MGEEQAKIHALNKIVSIIDEKASLYKNERKSMPQARALAEKKLILDLIDDGLKLAKTIRPKPEDLIRDLETLNKQMMNL